MSVEKQLEEIDKTINLIRQDSKRTIKASIDIAHAAIIELQFKKMDLVYKEVRMDNFLHFCNTGKFEY